LWFQRTSERIKPPYIEQLWLVVHNESLKATLLRVALLRSSLRSLIKVFTVSDDLLELKIVEVPERRELWKKRLAHFPPVPPANITRQTLQIIAEAPEAIDVVHARHGETLRYFGLKVAEDREHVLQGADYWRRVEAHRRRGHIARAKLFGERAIRDESPLVYLVAPTLRVHPSFQALARCVEHDIEIYRFDINE